jgi:hypothetical protein
LGSPAISLKASSKSISPRFSARNPKFLARDNKICVSALRYLSTKRYAKLALPEPACHETTYCSGFQLFGFLVYAVLLCARFFGFDDDLRHCCPPGSSQQCRARERGQCVNRKAVQIETFPLPGVVDGCQGMSILPRPRGDLRLKHSRKSRSTTNRVSISSWDGADFTSVPGRHPCPREIPQRPSAAIGGL